LVERMSKPKKKPPPRAGVSAPVKAPPKKRAGKFPAAGTSKAPELASLASLVVETETIELFKSKPWGVKPPAFTMSLEYVNCGRCTRAHGPYWFAFRRQTREGYGTAGKLIRVYIGAKKDTGKAAELLRARGVWPAVKK
jgi:hypothetical protein